MRLHAIRTLTNYNRAVSTDFFGIRNITNKDIAGAFSNTTKLNASQISEKYEPLLVARNRFANEEKESDVIFGHVRKDNQNAPKYHGQYDLDSEKKLYDTVTVKQSFVSHSPDETTKNESTFPLQETPEATEIVGNPAFRISEIEPTYDVNDIINLFKLERNASENILRYSNVPPLIYFFEPSDSIGGHLSSREENRKKRKVSILRKVNLRDLKSELNTSNCISNTSSAVDHTETESVQPDEPEIRRPQLESDKTAGSGVPLDELDSESDDYERRISESHRFDRSLDRKYDVKSDMKKTKKKAIEYLEEFKAHRVEPKSRALKSAITNSDRPYPLLPQLKLDSQGKYNYSNQVPDWHRARRADVLNYLEKSIVYFNNDIMAINKPYGLASHDEDRDRESYDVNSLIGDLAKSKFNISKVHLAHRLDKTTTGVLIFATSPDRARSLHKQFKSDEIKKKYLALVRGVPDPEAGIIDMPISEMSLANKIRMCPVVPNLPKEKQIAKRFTDARRAVTEYSTLSVGAGNISLLEIKPRSGVKHQIRCHLGFGLSTPIIGDHKYTDISKFAPQKLSSGALKALRLRQEKVRTLPIHLHAISVVIPNAKGNGETLFINAPLPHHFAENMKSLQIKYVS